ncbi:hypothetical protein [Nocardia altamirensis]|uniref:hypothetical protein n=1 Tax=Nocardia altamirensis TaxID=472158 RepID=UPI00114CBEB8|nr:hypothetical protein [Nocardia altamirensis]
MPRVGLALAALLAGVVAVQVTFAARVVTAEFLAGPAWIGLGLIDAGLSMMAVLVSADADHAMFQPWCSTCRHHIARAQDMTW